MLTLSPGSSCDVCAEEYGRQTVPHSIPCGHVLCYACCSAIVEKTPPRLSPACPFCREYFAIDGVRLIRMDLTGSSGWSTPKRFPCVEANPSEAPSEHPTKKKLNHLPLSEGATSLHRAEVRRLESKVHAVANRKCSVEEVKTLKEELEGWLVSDVKFNDQTSLSLSAALLRAILMNHMAHSEASKHAKTVEANLKASIDDMQLTSEKLEAEIRRLRLELTQKTHECQTLRSDHSYHRSGTLSPPEPSSRVTSPIPGIPSPPPSTSTSPTPYSTPNVTTRYGSVHARSASMSIAARSVTPSPSAPQRSYTPAPRSHTPNPTHTISSASASASAHRSQSLRRSQTPGPAPSAPPVPALPPRLATPGPTTTSHMLRSQTPAPHSAGVSASSNLSSSRSRRLSQPSAIPKQVTRSSSDETHQHHHQRWLPPSTAAAQPEGHRYGSSSTPVSRTPSMGPSARIRV